MQKALVQESRVKDSDLLDPMIRSLMLVLLIAPRIVILIMMMVIMIYMLLSGHGETKTSLLFVLT